MKGIDKAKEFLGMQERKHRKELAAFMRFHKMPIDPLITPWCAAFINACERAVGNPGNGMYNARSFLTYGTKVSLADAQKGDIVIFSRGGSTWQGHVSYFYKLENGLLLVLGGNQSDSVCIAKYDINRILGVRRYG